MGSALFLLSCFCMNWLEKVEKNKQEWYNRGKMKEKIHSDFKKYAKAHPPLGRAVLPLIRFYGKRLFAREKSGDGVRVDKYLIPTFDGKEISAILYSPIEERKETLPCLIYFHGGGYSLPAAKLGTLADGTMLPEGNYEMLVVVDAYDPETHEKSVLKTQLPITIHIVKSAES